MKVRKRVPRLNNPCGNKVKAVSSCEGTTGIPSLVVPSFDSTPFCVIHYPKLAV